MKKIAIVAVMAMVAVVMMTGCKIEKTAEAKPADVVKTYDVVETYDDTMIIETENGTEALQFDGMTEAEMYANHVIFVNGEYVGIAD